MLGPCSPLSGKLAATKAVDVHMKRRFGSVLLTLAVLAGACTDGDDDTSPSTTDSETETDSVDAGSDQEQDDQSDENQDEATGSDDGSSAGGRQALDAPVPDFPTGDLDSELDLALGEAVILVQQGIPPATLDVIAQSGDPRAAWVIVDLLRFLAGTPTGDRLTGVFAELTGVGVDPFSPWSSSANQMIAWDIPAPPNYLDYKRELYTTGELRWEPFFDANADIDWRHVGWGGVLVDDRPLGDNEPCPQSCIPALDSPGVTDASGGDWFPDEAVIFGVVIDGEARAYPRNIMEVHEMVMDELGGRRFGMPYCTLCGSAQAYYVDNVDGFDPVLRTSGLLIRSNKMMFDLETYSLIDTFTGRATTGPLAEAEVQLEQISVVTTTWGEWKAEHPDTTIVAEDGGIGREYVRDPLGGRDDNGPIFPVGEIDPRLPAQQQVLGLILDDNTTVGVDVEAAITSLEAGDEIVIEEFVLELDAGGVRAVRTDGTDAGAHQAFWFAWSQFHPGTKVWPADFQ